MVIIHFVVVVNTFGYNHENLLQTSYLKAVHDKQEELIIGIEQIKELCFYMKSPDMVNGFISHFPNIVERESF